MLLLAGLSACSGESGHAPLEPATAEYTTVGADSLAQEHPGAEAGISPDVQRHVHEIDSLLEGI
ncbi:hypothetical protein D770_20730 [Flammeovirgaceae bacterium 311]|nr:hypothetical protein D770_20730 [Flammeovirgaceae bacterium 311]